MLDEQHTPAEEAAVEAPSAPSRNAWDFSLMLLTVALLGTLGVQSFLGTLYVWWQANAVAGFDQSPAYARYISAMNAIAAPQLVALVVVMGLCVPKRLLSRNALVIASVAMLTLGAMLWLLSGSLAVGLGAYLAVSGLIQVAVVVLTLTGARGLTFLSDARLGRVGSGLLHLGFITTALAVVTLQHSPLLLPGFLVATGLTVVGTAMSFRARRVVG